MTKIAIGGILTECNQLGGVPIDMQLYEETELLRGDELLQQTTSVVGGMVAAMRDEGVEALPLLFASACAAGPIERDCYDALRNELLDRLKQVLPVDGVLLPLHGSASAVGVEDPEGDIARAVRELVGPDVPILMTVDLHAFITAEMVRHVDGILGWETYPHSDQYGTGQRATRLLMKTLRGECKPTMAMATVPVITSAIHGSTYGDDPFAELMRYTKHLEQRDDVLSTSLFLIHPYLDTPDMASGGLVITDNNLDLASELATDVAQRYWAKRRELEPEIFQPAEAIRMGSDVAGGPVILVETADCCGGGAAGDSIASLSALVDAGVTDTAYVPVVDPEAAAACHDAGVGAELDLALGHKVDPRWGDTRTFRGTVEKLTDGKFVFTGGQWEGFEDSMGKTAIFTIGSVKVLIASRATYDWATEQFDSVELDPRAAKFIVAKNPMNYRQAYSDFATKIIVLDTPGPTPATLKHMEFKKLQRPYFPADEDIPGLSPRVLT